MFFSSFAFAAAAAALQAVTPNRLRGQVSALYLFFVNLAGIGLGSFLTGWINDSMLRRPAAGQRLDVLDRRHRCAARRTNLKILSLDQQQSGQGSNWLYRLILEIFSTTFT
jgi:hypothetical protein